MGTKGDRRNKILVGGDRVAAQQFIGPANSQMEILKKQMSFQNRSQGVRRLWLYDDVYIECVKCFNYQECKIWVKPLEERGETVETEHNMLLVVYGDFERKLVVNSINGTFEAEPIVCGDDGYGDIETIKVNPNSGQQQIYGSFVHCFADGEIKSVDSNATASIQSCVRRHFQRLYSHREIIKDSVQSPKSNCSITSALDATFPSNIPCSDIYNLMEEEWSKTLDDFMVSPFVYHNIFWASPLRMWKVSASWKNKVIMWDGEENFGNFIRNVHTGSILQPNDPTQWTDTHIGFDLWKKKNEAEVFEYFVGIMSDQGETLYVFKLNFDTMNLEPQESYTSNIRGETGVYSETEEWRRYRYIRLLGYGYKSSTQNHVAYWAKLDRDESFYYEEILNGGGVTEHDVSDPESVSGGDIKSALWNPVKREVYIYLESGANPSEVVAPHQVLYEFGRVRVSHPAAGYTCYWDENGAPYTAEGSWHCRDNEAVSIPHTDCPLRYEINGEEYFYSAFCTEYPAGLDHLDHCFSNWTGKLRTPSKEFYMGTFNVHTGHYSKGRKIVYSTGSISAGTDASDSGENCCPASGYQNISTVARGSECDPNSVKRYTLNKWIFTPSGGGHVYEYSEDEMTTYIPDGEDPEWNSACEWEDDWSDYSIGNSTVLDAAVSEFPYDKGWTAILLEAKDQQGNTVSDWVMYKGSSGLFVVDSVGSVKADIGDYERGFFIKHLKITSMEV